MQLVPSACRIVTDNPVYQARCDFRWMPVVHCVR
jgi:hypothetical protein